ncbi:MAG TPA: fused MFS/spermidine synthase [Burkholderiaceae bacterium]|nr:fused MFS/spermidine synthase [Burkholderiaceae bacterium]
MALLYAVFFLSGVSALIYQTAWHRMLGLFGGSDAIAATLVVAAFLFGLGIGSLAATSFADRLSNRQALWAFAACELGIAGFAAISRFVFYDLLFERMIALAHYPALIFVLVFVALLPPTVLMGMSLPLLSKAIVRSIATASAQIGWLYGVNTLGAGIGAFAAGWLLIGAIGYEATVYLAAALNLLVGVVALSVAGGFDTRRGAAVRASLNRVPARIWYWSFLVFVSGFVIISLEIVWFRVLGLLTQSNAYSFPTVLGLVLVGDAIGIVIGAALIGRVANPKRMFFLLQGVVSLYALLSIGLLYAGHLWFPLATQFIDGPVWSDLSSGRLAAFLGLAAAVVLPPAVLFGLSFPITQKAVQDDPALIGQRVGLVQLFNILGNTAGSAVTGLVLLHWLGTAETLRLIGVIGLLFVAALLWNERRGPTLALATAVACAVAAFPGNAAFWSAMHGERRAGASLVDEDRTGVAVFRPIDSKLHRLYIGGHTQSTLPFLDQHGALGAIGPLMHPDPRTVLVIGHGTGGTPYAAAISPVTEKVRVVEIVESVYNVLRKHAATRPVPAFADGRVERVVGDGRHALFVGKERYDVIEADAIYPHSSHSGLLYSVEFFRQVRARLKPGGIYVQWVPTERTLASFLAVFPHVVRIGDVLLGSDQPIRRTFEHAADELLSPRARAHLSAVGWRPESLIAWLASKPVRVWGPDDPRPQDPLQLNTDLFPKDEFFLNKKKLLLWPSSGS